jgi:hypothetical protein
MAITNGLGQTKVGVRATLVQAQTTSLLLDSYSGATAAYSLRKLRSSYTGNAIKVRRSSDNAEMNIGFNSDGEINTFTLLTFIGVGNNGFVTTWYDQSGNGINLTQATAAYQTKIVNSVFIMTKNNIYCIDFTSGQYLRSDNRVIGLNETSVFNVFSIKSLTSRGVAWDIGKSDTSYNFYAFDINTYNTSGSKFGFYTSTTAFDSNISTNLNQNLISVISNNTSGNNIISNTAYYINNTQASLTNTGGGSGAVYSSFSSANRITVGDFQNFPAPFSGTHQEIIFYQTNQSTNRVGISNNINGYYSIYASDTDAQAFITAAGITDNTQINAINTLVTDLKSGGVWTKMKALYPFVGGTSTTHKWNLKDPRDLNDAFRLTFSGGWTHGSTGALPNGTTGYAETYFNPSTNLTLYNTHISFYSRTNNTLALWKTDFAVEKEISSGNMSTITLYAGTSTWAGAWITSTDSARVYAYIGNSTGLFLGNRTSVNNIQISRNGLVGGISTVNANTISGGTQYPTDSPIIGGKKYISPTNVVSYRDFSNREVAFASLGDGLTNYESYNFYKAVEKFQTSLGRQMGSNIPTSSDIDVQMFLNATQITDTTQINAISTLVSQLKSNNLWDKMRVIYPFVGGTSNTHKFNLKDPRDINEAYRLTFSGGVTHDSNGIKGSTNGYANTYFSPLTLNQNSIHFSWYSNMNSLGVKADIGTLGGGRLLGYSINGAGTNWAVRINNTSNVFSSTQTTDTIGFYQVSRTSSTSIIMQKNNTQDTVSSTSTTSQSNNIILLSGSGSAEFSDRQLQLVTIGEGLTTTEMNTLKTINDNYKTNLGR